MPYPDKVLADDEEVVAHLHPHALTAFWPVVRLLLVVGAASFGTALVPAGRNQGVVRLAVLVAAVLLLLVSVAAPLLRRRTTHLVVTTHRLLHRSGVVTRRGRDLALARITDVSFSQTLAERLVRSGTLRVASSGEEAVEMRRVPDVERVQTLLHHMVEEDADRRAHESGSPSEGFVRAGHATDGWGDDGWGHGGWLDDGGGDGGWGSGGPGYVTGWGTTEHRTSYHTDPVR